MSDKDPSAQPLENQVGNQVDVAKAQDKGADQNNEGADNLSQKNNEISEVVDETKNELGDFFEGTIDALKSALEKRRGKDDEKISLVLEKVAAIGKISFGFKLKSGANMVQNVVGRLQKQNPSAKLPDTINEVGGKIKNVGEQLDAISTQVGAITGKMAIGGLIGGNALGAFGNAPGGASAAEVVTGDSSVDTALTTLDVSVQQLKKQEGITTLAFKAAYVKLLQDLTVQLASDSNTPMSNAPVNAPVVAPVAQNAPNNNEEYDAPDTDIKIEYKSSQFTLPTYPPLEGLTKDKISSLYKAENPKRPKHEGIDFAVPIGTEIFASAPGKVIAAQEQVGKAGKYIDIDTGNFIVRYFHLSKFNVKEGDVVTTGELLGKTGNTGRSTGPHLHYEIRDKSQQIAQTGGVNKYASVNPKDFLDLDGTGSFLAMQTYGSKSPKAASIDTPIAATA